MSGKGVAGCHADSFTAQAILRVFRRTGSVFLALISIFNFNRRESVKGFINGLGKLSSQYILKAHKVKFYYHLLCVGNSLLTDLFWLYVSDCYFKDDCLHHIANHKHIAISAIYTNNFVVTAYEQLF